MYMIKEKNKYIICVLLTLLTFLTIVASNPMIMAKAADKKIEVKIPVSCVAKNSTETFVYRLEKMEDTSDDQYMMEQSLTNGETGTFTLTEYVPGTYSYKVSQRKGKDSNTIYDENVYRVDVYVTENDQGVMSAEPILYKEGETGKKAELVFNNKKRQDTAKISSTTTTKTGQTTKSVKTGDQTSILMHVLTAVLCACIIFLLLIGRRKEGEDE